MHGYEVSNGYMGRVFGKWKWFESEEAFRAYYKKVRAIRIRKT